MNNTHRIHLAGLACLVGGILEVVMGILHLLTNGLATDKPSPVPLLLLFLVLNICLMGGPLGLLACRAFGTGAMGIIGKTGVVVTLLGQLSFIVGMIYIILNPALEYVETFTPAGAGFSALGMLLVGIATLAARQLRGGQAFAPLLIPISYTIVLPIQIVLFISKGLQPLLPINFLFWGLMWALVGYALQSSTVEKQVPRSTVAQ